jgi:hypothetical protein
MLEVRGVWRAEPDLTPPEDTDSPDRTSAYLQEHVRPLSVPGAGGTQLLHAALKRLHGSMVHAGSYATGVHVQPLDGAAWEGAAVMLRRLELAKAVLTTVRICA